MEKNDRRNFLKSGAVFGSALFATSAFSAIGCNDTTNTEGKNLSAKSKTRTLGSGAQALNVSGLGLGCMGMS